MVFSVYICDSCRFTLLSIPRLFLPLLSLSRSISSIRSCCFHCHHRLAVGLSIFCVLSYCVLFFFCFVFVMLNESSSSSVITLLLLLFVDMFLEPVCDLCSLSLSPSLSLSLSHPLLLFRQYQCRLLNPVLSYLIVVLVGFDWTHCVQLFFVCYWLLVYASLGRSLLGQFLVVAFYRHVILRMVIYLVKMILRFLF